MPPAKSPALLPLALTAAGISLAYCLYPGNAPFIYDEPLLITAALDFNAKHLPANTGLFGSLGRPYGPLPTWIYQLLLLISHDLITVMTLRVALFMAAISVAVVSLAHSTRMWRWGGLPALLSPFVYLYARQLWDNSFNIPLGLLSLAAYAAFLRKPSGPRLYLATLLTLLMLLVHLMALPFVIAVFAVLLIHHRPQLREYARPFALALLTFGILAAPYAVKFLTGDNLTSLAAAPATRPSVVTVAAFPLLAPQILSAFNLDYFFRLPSEVGLPAAYLHTAGIWSTCFHVTAFLSLAAFPLIGVTLLRLRSTRAPLPQLCLLAVFLHFTLTLLTARINEPHYFNALFAPLAYLLWLALDRLASTPILRRAATLYLASLAVTTALLAARLHQTNGTRSIPYGPTLTNQLHIAKQLQHLPPNHTLENQTPLFPIALTTHQALLPPLQSPHQPTPQPTPQPTLYLLRHPPTSPNDNGTIELVPTDK